MTSPYVSNRGWTITVQALFGTGMLLTLSEGVGHFRRMGLVQAYMAGRNITQAHLQAADQWVNLIGWLSIVVYFLTGIGFMVWMYRAHKNLPGLGAAALQYSPGWAVGAWFIPVLNFFRPFQVMKEIWQASDPDSAGDSVAWQSSPGSPLLGLWWGFYLGQGVFTQIAATLSRGAQTLETFVSAERWAIVGGLFDITAAVFAFLVVLNIHRRQSERSQRLTAQSSIPG